MTEPDGGGNVSDSCDTNPENIPLDVLENITEGCQVISPDYRYLYVNDAAVSHSRTTKERLLGRTMMETYPGIEETPLFSTLQRCMQDRSHHQMDNEFTFPDGSKGSFDLMFEPVPEGVCIFSMDITARKRMEKALLRTNRALATLSECNHTLVRATDEQQFLQDVCRIAVEAGGYLLAWIGVKENDESKSVRVAAHAGNNKEYINGLQITWDDSAQGRGPTGRAIRSGEIAIVRFIETERDFEPWRKSALAHGFASSIALPFRIDGEIAGALNIYSAETDAFDVGETDLLKELAEDLGHGIQTLRGQIAAKNNESRIQHLNAALRGIRNVNQLIIREHDPQALIQKACDLLVESSEFDTCCIIVCDDDRVKFVADAGVQLGRRALRIMLAAGDMPDCVKRVISEADLVVRRNPAESCAGCPVGADFPDERDAVAIRLESDGSLLGAMLVSLASGVASDQEEISLLREVAGDVAFALRGIEIEAERARAVEEVRASAAKWSATFDAITDIVCVLSTNHEFIEINKAGSEALGMSKEEIIGRKCFELVHGTDAPIPACPCTRTAQTLEPGTGFHEQDGRSLELIAWPIFGPERKLEALVHVVKDVSEMKNAQAALQESERQYRSLVEDMEDVVFSLDPEGRVKFISSAARNFGYSSGELIGSRFSRLVHPDDLAGVEESFARTLAGDSEPFEFRTIDEKGEVRFVRASSRAVIADGRPAGVTGVLIDVSKQKGMEEQLRMSQKMEAVGRLAGGVAHDFNNLLSVIISYADFAVESLRESDPLMSDIVEIRNAGQRAASLTRQLLAFSRRQVLEPAVLDLNKIVLELEKMLQRLLGEDVELTVHVAGDLGSIEADPGQIEQVVMNLAVNARDAMPRGGKLTIETANIELDGEYQQQHVAVNPGQYVVLSVTDTGCGMDAATRARIFEPFFTSKEMGKGTGLGLSTVYGIVKQSGGNIWVYSEPEHGTTFKVYMPRVDAPATDVRRRPPSVMATGNETVLVVEDEDAVRKLADRILRVAGYKVLTAANGGEALLICEQHKGELHLLLTDVVMPQMGGRQLAERLTKIRPELRVLYMSGYTDNAIVHHGVLDPGTRFISKPFSAPDLTRKVREALDEDKEGSKR